QKIEMKVHMTCEKCRKKALGVAVSANGVIYAGIEGEEKNKLVVIGNGVDAVKLTNSLRKKVGKTDIISLAEQKIVMKVQMNCSKCRTKALEVASGTNGVNSVSIEGESKDQVVVIGVGVDAVNLTSCMRKKVGYTDLVTVAEAK
ncbi:Heavy metal-associated isoprenylated plant protein 47, partial [Mucuna pruriens]